MLEIPEAHVIAQQLREQVTGKRISMARANASPHSLAWYSDHPEGYSLLLKGKVITGAQSHGGMVQMDMDGLRLLFADGVGLRYHESGKTIPKKHQLLLKLEDGSALTAAVQMYGGIWCFPEGDFDNIYYEAAQQKPSPLSKEFGPRYFRSLLLEEGAGRLSAKAFLATEQRIPGLGNGVLQDILFLSGIHPKRKMTTVSAEQKEHLYRTLVKTLRSMARQGGRDTEKDLYGFPGGYMTQMSRLTVGTPCPLCGETIQKAAYMGGNIYFCPVCQPFEENR